MAVQPQETSGAQTPESNPVLSQAQRNVSEVMSRLQNQGLSVGKEASAQQSNERFFTQTLGLERSQFTSASGNVYSFRDIEQALISWSEGKSVSAKYQHIIHTILKHFLPDSFAKLSDDAAIQRKFGSIQKIIFAPTSKIAPDGKRKVADMLTGGQEPTAVDRDPRLRAESAQVPQPESQVPVSTEQVTAQQPEQHTAEGLTPNERANFDFFLGTLHPLIVENYGGQEALLDAYTQWLHSDSMSEEQSAGASEAGEADTSDTILVEESGIPIDRLFAGMLYVMLDDDGRAVIESDARAAFVLSHLRGESIASALQDPEYLAKEKDQAWTQEAVRNEFERQLYNDEEFNELLYSTPESRMRLFERNVALMTEHIPPVMARRVNVEQLRTALSQYAAQLAGDTVWNDASLSVEEKISELRFGAISKAKILLKSAVPIGEDWQSVLLGEDLVDEQIDSLVWWLVEPQNGAKFTEDQLRERFSQHFTHEEVLEVRNKGAGRRILEVFGGQKRPTEITAKYSPEEHPLYQGETAGADQPLIKLPPERPESNPYQWQAHIDYLIQQRFQAHIAFEEATGKEPLNGGEALSNDEYWQLQREAFSGILIPIFQAVNIIAELDTEIERFYKIDHLSTPSEQIDGKKLAISRLFSRLKKALSRLPRELNPIGRSRQKDRQLLLPGWETFLDGFLSIQKQDFRIESDSRILGEYARVKSAVVILEQLCRKSIQERVLGRNGSEYVQQMLRPSVFDAFRPKGMAFRKDAKQQELFALFVENNKPDLIEKLFETPSFTSQFDDSIRPLIAVMQQENEEQTTQDALLDVFEQEAQWRALSANISPELQQMRDWMNSVSSAVSSERSASFQLRSVSQLIDMLTRSLNAPNSYISLDTLRSDNRSFRLSGNDKKSHRQLNVVEMFTEVSRSLESLIIELAQVIARKQEELRLAQMSANPDTRIHQNNTAITHLISMKEQLTRLKTHFDSQLTPLMDQFVRQVDTYVQQVRKENKQPKTLNSEIQERLGVVERALTTVGNQIGTVQPLVSLVEQSAPRGVSVSVETVLVSMGTVWMDTVQPALAAETDRLLRVDLLPSDESVEPEE